MGKTYDKVKEFRKRHRGCVAWRTKRHSAIIDQYLNPHEEVLYAFVGQKNEEFYNVLSSCVVAITNKRILIGQKRFVWGHFLDSITPDLYNDLQIYQGLFFGKITIDTVKEVVVISNLSKGSLDEIETIISEFMIKQKKKLYGHKSKCDC